MKKKVAILGLHLGYGGVEQCIANLANMLCEDYTVELAITYRVVDEIPYRLDPRVTVKYLTDLKPNRQELKDALSDKKLWKAFKEGCKSLHILRMRTKKMASYIQKSDADIIVSTRVLYTELLSKYRKKGVITIAQEHCHHNQNQSYIKRVKKSCKHIDYLMPVSQELTDFYEKEINNDHTKLMYIPNALEYFPSENSKLEEKNIISIGRISPEKGYLDLIDVFSLVHQKHPDWKLKIVGDGKEMPRLKEKIQSYHLEDDVILHGFQTKEQIYEHLLHSSIYVMCSYEESFGIVLLEAASFGIPILAYSSAQGAHEIIKDQENGYLISNRDAKEMANRIEELILDHDKAIHMGKIAKKSVEQYSFPVVKKRWLKFLSSLEEQK